jgi:hypothetical protein
MIPVLLHDVYPMSMKQPTYIASGNKAVVSNVVPGLSHCV